MIERIGSASPYEARVGFCRALRTGRRILVAGTAPIPQDGTPPPVSAHDQMLLCGRIAMDAVRRLGGAEASVVRTRMYLVDPADADAVGEAHAAVFGPFEPVATMVVVAALPLVSTGTDANVQVRGISPRVLAVRHAVRVSRGRFLEDGMPEIVAGRNALLSYSGVLAWGLAADWELVPDLALVRDALERAFAELREMALLAQQQRSRVAANGSHINDSHRNGNNANARPALKIVRASEDELHEER